MDTYKKTPVLRLTLNRNNKKFAYAIKIHYYFF